MKYECASPNCAIQVSIGGDGRWGKNAICRELSFLYVRTKNPGARCNVVHTLLAQFSLSPRAMGGCRRECMCQALYYMRERRCTKRARWFTFFYRSLAAQRRATPDAIIDKLDLITAARALVFREIRGNRGANSWNWGWKEVALHQFWRVNLWRSFVIPSSRKDLTLSCNFGDGSDHFNDHNWAQLQNSMANLKTCLKNDHKISWFIHFFALYLQAGKFRFLHRVFRQNSFLWMGLFMWNSYFNETSPC
jgi:hypothetical protein